MNASFVSSAWDAPHDATAWHSALPRAMRKTLRLPHHTKHQPQSSRAHTDLTETFRRDAYITDAYHNQNHEYADNAYGADEFNDIDNELDGLTITEPMDEAELFRFCTGYDVI